LPLPSGIGTLFRLSAIWQKRGAGTWGTRPPSLRPMPRVLVKNKKRGSTRETPFLVLVGASVLLGDNHLTRHSQFGFHALMLCSGKAVIG
ncbi:MAG: hypothetical protein KAT75_10570, partial [Dehalococcoidia bacterium]|nr:hypothetical protein [Dehalococcoidia bacterium]